MFLLIRRLLDCGFIVGLVFALFLAGKIVPYLLVVGVLPIALFWASADYSRSSGGLVRFLGPSSIYFGLCLLLLFAYPGLPLGEPRPRNPDLELYMVGIGLLAVGYLRGLQIENISKLFHDVAPWALVIAFGVLSVYMFLGIDGCRVQVAASWPFIPAIIFTTLTFLLLLEWELRAKWQRIVRLVLLTFSIVVVLAYTGSRGIAIGQFLVLFALGFLRAIRTFRTGLPSLTELGCVVTAGITLSMIVGISSGCDSFNRWPALVEMVNGLEWKSEAKTSSVVPNGSIPSLASDVPLAAPESSPVVLSADRSITLRLDMWLASLEAAADSPLIGHGALSLSPIIQKRFGFEHNHNQYLAWLVTGGALLVTSGLLFLSTPWLISKGLPYVDRTIITLSVTALWGISMVFDAFLSLDFYLHYFSLLLGFLFALNSNMMEKNRAE